VVELAAAGDMGVAVEPAVAAVLAVAADMGVAVEPAVAVVAGRVAVAPEVAVVAEQAEGEGEGATPVAMGVLTPIHLCTSVTTRWLPLRILIARRTAFRT
jgi:hypothetical protein